MNRLAEVRVAAEALLAVAEPVPPQVAAFVLILLRDVIRDTRRPLSKPALDALLAVVAALGDEAGS